MLSHIVEMHIFKKNNYSNEGIIMEESIDAFCTQNDKTIFHYETEEGVSFLTFALFDDIPWLKSIFTTRKGGVSKGIYSELNLSYSRGDSKEAVDENFRRVARVMDTTPARIVCSDQTHTSNIRVVRLEDAGKGLVRECDYSDIDALITNVPELVLACFYADCVPLYIVDPVNRAIGLCHSGWRGTRLFIGEQVIRKMQEEFGTDPKKALAAIGPSICKDCYEISEDVAKEFREFSFYQKIVTPKENGKYNLDLWETNHQIFLRAGLQEEHIAVTNICTSCNKELLFSHRATNGKRGNLGAFMKIKESVNDKQ